MKHPIIAIDGPSASGKSTLARLLSQKLGFQVVESGKYYRFVTYTVLARELPVENQGAIIDGLTRQPIPWEQMENDSITKELRGDLISKVTPILAAIPELRNIVNDQLRNVASQTATIMEGRDIGTFVFPNTPWKLFLDVPLSQRESRRSKEGSGENIVARDQIDSTRKNSPLMPAEDAIILTIGNEDAESVCLRSLDCLISKGLDHKIQYPITAN